MEREKVRNKDVKKEKMRQNEDIRKIRKKKRERK